MVMVECYVAPVASSIVDSIIDLVADNVTSLSMTHPPADHPFFKSYQKALILEFNQYLNMKGFSRMEVVVATDEERIVGFALCGLPLDGNSDECGIYYIAVHKNFRCMGIMGRMVGHVTERYPHVALSCDVSLVPVYERYGFVCHEVRQHQITMFFGRPVRETPVLSVSELRAHPEVVAEQNTAAQKFGRHKVDRANKALEKKLKADAQNAKRFFEERVRVRS